MMKLEEWDLSQRKNILKWLRRCRLPDTPFVVYLLRSEARNVLQPRLDQRFHVSRQSIPALLEAFFPFSPPDLDTIPSTLGHPLDTSTAMTLIRQDIDVSKIPDEQKSSIDVSTRTLVDQILLQQIPFSECIQIRHTGEILSRETFNLLLQNNKTIWIGKESIGFKTPRLQTLFGNLVSYNYDLQNYFPQKAGTLTITSVMNSGRVPCQDKPDRIVPSHYFRLDYFGHTSYLPDTKEGRRVLALMKDAFKKGNLYGFSRKGRVRQGRIHKKTTLQGTYGYPDNTYLERVTGELRSLGSSPFTFQFAPNASWDPATDPYPKEKRFVLRFA